MPVIQKQNLHGKLPLTLPQPCPICGAKVILTIVVEWGSDDGMISQTESECETEPDIDSEDWEPWFAGHFNMPYVDWMPWENRMMTWLNERYFYGDTE